MASGKLSPRQKMINMMYLVLLALLAMNVSAEILEAFEQIKEKLHTSAQQNKNTNTGQADRMLKAIQEEIGKGKTDNVGLTDTVNYVRQATNDILGIIAFHEDTLEQIAGKDEVTGKIENKGESEKNYQYWMGRGSEENQNDGRGAKAAYQLHQDLDSYIDKLVGVYNAIIPDSTPELRLDATNEYLAKDPEETLDGEAKTWERYTFHNPVVANLALLEALKLDILKKEKQTLDIINTRLGVNTFEVDSVIGDFAAVSEIVPAGLQYEAKLYVTMASSAVTPRFNSGSGAIKQEGPIGRLTINANGGLIPKGKSEAKQSWSATITVPKASGGSEVIPVKGEFTVRRPEIVVTSASVSLLYRKCANEVNIDVPALGDNYNPRFSGNNVEVTTSKSSKKLVRLIPGGGKKASVVVRSLTNGQTVEIGRVDYRVVEPPKPAVNMAVNGRIYNGASMVPKTSRVQVRLEPDADFKAALPNDAKYGIGGIEVLAQLSLGPPTRVNSIPGQKNAVTKPVSVSLGNKVRQSSPGTKVYVRLNDIYRVNFKGQKIVDKRFNEVERTLSLVVK
ncbi:MAG: hypothetical protein MRZ79_23255 [Bacteroidia bacterium]|nr:hypothetical protein [Bacteroidia bacterium]